MTKRENQKISSIESNFLQKEKQTIATTVDSLNIIIRGSLYLTLKSDSSKMGKIKKKDPAKKAALAAKKDAKADKAARKRMKKEAEALGAGMANGTNDPDAMDNDGLDATNADTALALDDLLQIYQKRDVQGSKALVETLEGFPLPRGNFTMTVVEDNAKSKLEVYVFGGEYFDGVSSIVVDHLLKWTCNNSSSSTASTTTAAAEQGNSNSSTSSSTWQQIIMPQSSLPSPPARCAHSCVYYNGCLYVFGGELATTDYYHHYKDVWKFDIARQVWQELKFDKIGTQPSSRSGHSAIVWKHYMIIFGGFYEAAREVPRWFNDVCVLNLKTEQWLDVPYSKLGARPEPRSACNIGLLEDDRVVVHGGFSKLPSAAAVSGKETKVHTDGWLLHLKPILSDKPPTWEKILSSSTTTTTTANARNPNGRSACASTTYKNKMIVFGGVVDAELMHHKVDSVFFNNIYCLDVGSGKPKWFPLHIRKQKASVTTGSDKNDDNDDENNNDDLGAREDQDEKDETFQKNSHGWNIKQLRENMFAFVDGSGNLVYEKMNSTNKTKNKKLGNTSDSEEEKEESKQDDSSDEEEEFKEDETPISKMQTSSSVMIVDPQTKSAQAVQRDEPLPRIKCGAIVNRHTLFIYGGLVEIGDREVTLDDMWSLDLRKRDGWTCVYPGTMHKQVWRGAIHDDDDSYISTGTGNNDDDDDDDNDDDDSGSDVDDELIVGADRDAEKNTEELVQLRSDYDLDNAMRTPQEGEALADFYSRTSAYWNEQATEALKASGGPDEPTKKELKREGFQLARTRFEELESILERFKLLEIGSNRKSKPKKGKQDKKEHRKKSNK